MAISSKFKSSLIDVRSYRGADVSDHHLIGTIRVKTTKVRRPYFAAKKKLDLKKLKTASAEESFKTVLSEKTGNQHSPDPAECWKQLAGAMRSTAETTLGFKNFQRKEWISDDT